MSKPKQTQVLKNVNVRFTPGMYDKLQTKAQEEYEGNVSMMVRYIVLNWFLGCVKNEGGDNVNQ